MKINFLKTIFMKITKFCITKPIIAGVIGIAVVATGVTTGVIVHNNNSKEDAIVEESQKDTQDNKKEDTKTKEEKKDNKNEKKEEEKKIEKKEEDTSSEKVDQTQLQTQDTPSQEVANTSASTNTTENVQSNQQDVPQQSTPQQTTQQPSVNTTPSGISQINESFKQRYLENVGCFYNGSKKASFDNMINQVATGQRNANDVCNEINAIGSFADTDGTQRVISHADVKTFTSKSNDVESIMRECYNNGTLYGGTYTGVAMYWDQPSQTNTIYVLSVTVGTQVIEWN